MKYLKIFLFTLLFFVVVFIFFSINNDIGVLGFSGAGSGTAADPYQITDADELNETRDDLNANYTLMNDIDLTGCENWNSEKGFICIGNSTSFFNGSFNGGNHTISNLVINRTGGDGNSYGFFGVMRNASISNITLEDISITNVNGARVGGLSAYDYNTTFSYCYIIGGDINAGNRIGGMLGKSYGSFLSNCYTTVNVTGTSWGIGGLIGMNYFSNVSNCYSTGDISGVGNVGGLVGYNGAGDVGSGYGGNYSNCYATGDVTNTGGAAGGLVGWSWESDFNDCYSTGDVTSTSDYVGGFVGTYSYGDVVNCTSYGNVIGSTHVGGFIGEAYDLEITDCWSSGSVTYNSYGGWFIGYAEDIDGGIKVNAYNSSDNTDIGFDVSVFNENNVLIYQHSGCTNTHTISYTDMSPVSYNVTVVISATNYTTRMYTMNLYLYMYRTLDAYLTFEDLTNLYLLTVMGPVGEYTSEPVTDVKMVISQLVGSSYKNISSTYTDGNGQCMVNLIPGIVYTVTLSKTGYTTRTEYYIPSATSFTHTFRIYPTTGTATEYDTFSIDIDSFMQSSNSSLNVSMVDSNNSMTNWEILVFEVYNGIWSLNQTESGTSNTFTFWVDSINISRKHVIKLFYNNTADFMSSFDPPLYFDVFPIDTYVEGATPFNIENRLDSIFGDNPLGWTNIISVILAMIVLVSLGPFNVGASIIGAGISLGFMQVIFEIWFTNSFNALLALLVPVLVFIGILYFMTKGSGEVSL